MLGDMLLSCYIKLIFLYLDLFRQVQSPGNNITLGWELGAWPGYSLHYLLDLLLHRTRHHIFSLTAQRSNQPSILIFQNITITISLLSIHGFYPACDPEQHARSQSLPLAARPALPKPASLERWPGPSTESRPQFPGEHFLSLYTKL